MWPFREPQRDEPEGVAAVDAILARVDHIAEAVEELKQLVVTLQREKR